MTFTIEVFLKSSSPSVSLQLRIDLVVQRFSLASIKYTHQRFFLAFIKRRTPSTMSLIQYACSLNNQGVNLLVAGESSRAVIAFRSALDLLKTALHEAEKNTCTVMDQAGDDVSLPFCESILSVSGFQGLHGYVYDHGIIITTNGSNDASEATITLFIAVVLFNLALTSHRQGTVLGRANVLTKASVLYSLVVQLLATCTMPEDAATTILTLLALNNKAQIHYDQCEYVESVDCMKRVSHIISSGCGFHSALSHEALEGLLLNVMLMRTPSAAQAA
jgi:hypothetical protein